MPACSCIFISDASDTLTKVSHVLGKRLVLEALDLKPRPAISRMHLREAEGRREVAAELDWRQFPVDFLPEAGRCIAPHFIPQMMRSTSLIPSSGPVLFGITEI